MPSHGGSFEVPRVAGALALPRMRLAWACCGCSAAGAGRLALVRVCARCRVLIGDVADGDGLVAVGAQAAEVDADAGSVAFVAPLLAEVADAAFGALVDGDAASGGAWWQRDDRWGCLVMVAGAPGGLAAGG